MAPLNSKVVETNAAGGAPEMPESQRRGDERGNEVVTIEVWVFLSFAALTLIPTAIKGFVPLDLLEVAFWAGLAWFWHKKKIASQLSRVIVGILAILVAFGEGYSVARHSTTSYTYLQMGTHQVRIDNAAGRTDQLWTTGWKPMSFDRPAGEINAIQGIFDIPLSNVRWEGQQICASIQNNSDYVIKSIEILVKVTPKSTAASASELSVVMHPEVYGLLDIGDEDNFCGAAETYPGNAEWSYQVQKYEGWKR
jgi:hypothetical protein